MASSPDHPEIQFVQASGYTSGRPDGAPLWIVVHDMEADETPNTAENTANYFATGAGGRDVSSHYCADSNSVVQCVRLADVAWTVGNRPGNNRGINWELAGFASQTRDQWLDTFGQAMFAMMAPIVRSDAARYGIPLVRRTVVELRAYVPGVTSHNDLGVAFGGTDHTDPGPNFPWDYFLEVMNGGDVSSPEEIYIQHVMNYRLEAVIAMRDPIVIPPVLGKPEIIEPNKLAQAIRGLSAGGGTVDVDALADAVADELHADPERDGRDT